MYYVFQSVQTIFDVPLNLMVVSPAHLPNWDLVADIVNSCSRVYRSAKQCKNRYENVVIPREEGRILYDINPKKQSKKTKGIYKVCKHTKCCLYVMWFPRTKIESHKKCGH
jgi:E1A-binding protein p400